MFKEQLQLLRVRLLVSFLLSYIDFQLLTNCCSVAGYMLEPHCQRWSQPHMWHVAGQQLQCILCSDWPLDWGVCGWQVNHQDCTDWVCAMNMAHNGIRPGRALYKVCNHLWILAKVSTDSMRQILTNQSLQVGHITCDNARNNDTMLKEFTCCYQAKTGSKFDIKPWQIRYVSFRLCSCGTQSTKYRCLAHIINVATQAVILYLLIANQSFTMAILMMTTSLKMWVALNVTRLALSMQSVSRCVHFHCYMPVFLTWRYWRRTPQLSTRRLSSQSSTVVKSGPSSFCSIWKCGGVPHLWWSLVQSHNDRYLCPTFGITLIDCAGSWWVHLWTQAQGK